MESQFLKWLNFMIALFLGWQLFLIPSAIAAPVSSGNSVQETTSEILSIPLEHRLQIIQDLEEREILTSIQAQQQRDYYCKQPDRSTTKLLQRVGGIFTLSNVIWIFSSILLVFSLGGLFSLYLWPLFRSIPVLAYEIIAYLLGFGIVNRLSLERDRAFMSLSVSRKLTYPTFLFLRPVSYLWVHLSIF